MNPASDAHQSCDDTVSEPCRYAHEVLTVGGTRRGKLRCGVVDEQRHDRNDHNQNCDDSTEGGAANVDGPATLGTVLDFRPMAAALGYSLGTPTHFAQSAALLLAIGYTTAR